MAARFLASTWPRRWTSSRIAARCRCSTMPMRPAMVSAMTSTVPAGSLVCRGTKRGRDRPPPRKPRRRPGALTARPPRGGAGATGIGPEPSWAVEPDLPKGDVGVAQPVDLDAPDVRLEEPLVRVVPDRDHRRVVDDQLLDPAVQLHPAGPGPPRPGPEEHGGGRRGCLGPV